MRPFLQRLSNIATCYVSCYPNAGLPNTMGEYDEGPQQMAKILQDMASDGFCNIIGGCCGTTPDHIKAISEAVSKCSPRKIPNLPQQLVVSGLEPLVFTPNLNFVNIGERCNVTGSKRFANLIKANKYDVKNIYIFEKKKYILIFFKKKLKGSFDCS